MINITRSWCEERVRNMEFNIQVSHLFNLLDSMVGIIHHCSPVNISIGSRYGSSFAQLYPETFVKVLNYYISMLKAGDETEELKKILDVCRLDGPDSNEYVPNIETQELKKRLSEITPSIVYAHKLFDKYEEEMFHYCTDEELSQYGRFELVALDNAWNSWDCGLRTVDGKGGFLTKIYES